MTPLSEARGAVFEGACNELSLLMKHSPGRLILKRLVRDEWSGYKAGLIIACLRAVPCVRLSASHRRRVERRLAASSHGVPGHLGASRPQA